MPGKNKRTKAIIAILEEALRPVSFRKQVLCGDTVYYSGDSMFAGVHDNRIFLRLSADDRFALADQGGEPFELQSGSGVTDCLVLPPTLDHDGERLSYWLARSAAYTTTLGGDIQTGVAENRFHP